MSGQFRNFGPKVIAYEHLSSLPWLGNWEVEICLYFLRQVSASLLLCIWGCARLRTSCSLRAKTRVEDLVKYIIYNAHKVVNFHITRFNCHFPPPPRQTIWGSLSLPVLWQSCAVRLPAAGRPVCTAGTPAEGTGRPPSTSAPRGAWGHSGHL